jgi:hypothetical protein
MDIGKYTDILADSLPVQKDPKWIQINAAMHPEWIRIAEAVRLFSISRSKLYELIAAGKIKSFCLRERNKVKGIRLISFDSMSAFLDREAKLQQETSE